MNLHSIENPVIITTDEEVRRMMKSCSGEDGALSRDFMDWYAVEDSFPHRKGLIMVNDVYTNQSEQPDKRMVIGYDFTDANNAVFILYNYKTHRHLGRFKFERYSNLWNRRRRS